MLTLLTVIVVLCAFGLVLTFAWIVLAPETDEDDPGALELSTDDDSPEEKETTKHERGGKLEGSIPRSR